MPEPVPPPVEIQIIGEFLAIRWADGVEDFLSAPMLRAASPSAENVGERDLLGRQLGGAAGDNNHAGVALTACQPVGAYALILVFSDGHRTGIYSHAMLRELGARARAAGEGMAGA
jgi:DUF971 family protein